MKEYSGWYTTDTDRSLRSATSRSNGILENYQTNELFTAINYVTNFECGIDIGAHVGLMSNHMSKRFEQVHAFEISPMIYECLEFNVKHHELDNVITYNLGVGAIHENVDLTISTEKTFSTHITPNSTGKHSIIPIDSLGLENVGFIKIDAEGYEGPIIEGAMETITQSKPVILYERKGHGIRYGYHRDAAFEMLQELGYWFPERPWPKNGILMYNPPNPWKKRNG